MGLRDAMDRMGLSGPGERTDGGEATKGSALTELLSKLNEGQMWRDVPGPEDWIRVSEIPTLCPREILNARKLGLRKLDRGKTPRWRMDLGSAIHRWIQSEWLGKSGALLGTWKCLSCGRPASNNESAPGCNLPLHSRPASCPTCQAHNLSYVEPTLRDHELLIVGHCDGILQLGSGLEILELKTTRNLREPIRRYGKTYQPLSEAPAPDHILQLHWYMELADIRSGRILYIDPGAASLGSGIVEHHVQFDHSIIANSKNIIAQLRQALRNTNHAETLQQEIACPRQGQGPYGPCGCTLLPAPNHGHSSII